MKIEKISDSQIRCTLSKSDLIDRELRISELAYGTEKAKALFRDMMQQASLEFGFEAEDIPLMIEAIPVSSECLVLVITKVEDPDELDTRFSKFSSSDVDTGSDDYDDTIDQESYADEVLNCFNQLGDLLSAEKAKDEASFDIDTEEDTNSSDIIEDDSSEPTPQTKINVCKIFSFTSLEEVIHVSSILVSNYHGENTLYKDPTNSIYYLVMNISDHTPEEFNKVCNIISEYGKSEKSTYATVEYYKEHFEIITKNDAIQILSVM